jgi:hypothetical protein
MLHTPDATILLVGEGKVAARAAVSSLRNKHVRASGTPLHRGELTLLELNAPLESAGGGAELPDPAKPQSLREFRGEILDPKCFAGAMKPGDGKTHKACAALCLRGGIPPVFRSGGQLYLLVDQDLNPFAAAALQRIIEHVGDDVTVVGGVTTIGHLKVLAIDAGTIRRRGP